MPKRRVTAAQKAASRRNLVKARAARSKKSKHRIIKQDGVPLVVPKDLRRPMGKNVLLVHSSAQSDKILKEGFKGTKTGKVYFTNAREAHNYSGFGRPLSVIVPRKHVRKDRNPIYTDSGPMTEHSLFGAVTVHVKNLKGVKIKRHRL